MESCEIGLIATIRSDSGIVVLQSVDPIKSIIWTGRAGWVELEIGQYISRDGRLVITTFGPEAQAESPTRVWERGRWLDRNFLETAEVLLR